MTNIDLNGVEEALALKAVRNDDIPVKQSSSPSRRTTRLHREYTEAELEELAKSDLDEKEKCTQCGEITYPMYENTGFTAPDPVHYELVGFKCPHCGHYQSC